MKFGKLIEYDMRNIFLEKSYTKCGREPIPRLFYEKSKLTISGSTVWNFINFFLIICPSRGLLKNIKTKVLTTYFYLK